VRVVVAKSVGEVKVLGGQRRFSPAGLVRWLPRGSGRLSAPSSQAAGRARRSWIGCSGVAKNAAGASARVKIAPLRNPWAEIACLTTRSDDT